MNDSGCLYQGALTGWVFGDMTEEDAHGVMAWRYPTPYDFYDLTSDIQTYQELLNGSYGIAKTVESAVAAFYCSGESARVPAGYPAGAYSGPGKYVDVGLGLRPDLTGSGYGQVFMGDLLTYFGMRFPEYHLRLSVATFNQRAIVLYQRMGFDAYMTFRHAMTEFLVMVRLSQLLATLKPSDDEG